jgi:hypothetical protein
MYVAGAPGQAGTHLELGLWDGAYLEWGGLRCLILAARRTEHASHPRGRQGVLPETQLSKAVKGLGLSANDLAASTLIVRGVSGLQTAVLITLACRLARAWGCPDLVLDALRAKLAAPSVTVLPPPAGSGGSRGSRPHVRFASPQDTENSLASQRFATAQLTYTPGASRPVRHRESPVSSNGRSKRAAVEVADPVAVVTARNSSGQTPGRQQRVRQRETPGSSPGRGKSLAVEVEEATGRVPVVTTMNSRLAPATSTRRALRSFTGGVVEDLQVLPSPGGGGAHGVRRLAALDSYSRPTLETSSLLEALEAAPDRNEALGALVSAATQAIGVASAPQRRALLRQNGCQFASSLIGVAPRGRTRELTVACATRLAGFKPSRNLKPLTQTAPRESRRRHRRARDRASDLVGTVYKARSIFHLPL